MSRRRAVDRIAGAALALALAPSATARADSFTAGLLYDQCRSMTRPEANDSGRLICASYIRGIVDTIRVRAFEATGSAEAHVKVMPFCFPEGLGIDAAAGAFARHVEAGRAARTDGAAIAVVEAFRAAWPCSR